MYSQSKYRHFQLTPHSLQELAGNPDNYIYGNKPVDRQYGTPTNNQSIALTENEWRDQVLYYSITARCVLINIKTRELFEFIPPSTSRHTIAAAKMFTVQNPEYVILMAHNMSRPQSLEGHNIQTYGKFKVYNKILEIRSQFHSESTNPTTRPFGITLPENEFVFDAERHEQYVLQNKTESAPHQPIRKNRIPPVQPASSAETPGFFSPSVANKMDIDYIIGETTPLARTINPKQ